jgi:glutathione peroxidase
MTTLSGTGAMRQIPLKAIDGQVQTLDDYRGEVLLVVNVASQCGLTPQYEALERLYQRYRDRGLRILGFPANDFLQQEPGTDEEIATFCKTSYDVSFPLFSKIAVTGAAQHPLYGALIQAEPHSQGDPEIFRERLVGYGIETNPEPGVLWNFEKFLIGRDGTVRARFAPSVEPEESILVEAIERTLAE